MNSRERFLAALNGQRPDRTPLAHVSALTTTSLQDLTGCRMPWVHQDPEALARLGFANHEVLGFDAVSFIINFFNEPAALGCTIDWGHATQLPMYGSHPWSRAEDAVIPGDLLDRPPIRVCRETVRIARKQYGTRVAVIGKIMGPFSMVQVMHGVENVMMGLLENPKQIQAFINTATDILIRCGNAQLEAGADALAIGEGGAGANMLSPQMYQDFLLGVHQRLIRNLHGPTIMHICGDITPRLDLMGQIGLTCFNFDWNIAPAAMKQAAGGKFKIMGNVSTSDLLTGSPQTIEEQVRENLEAGVDIVSPGCAVSPLCPNENFQAMGKAITNGRMHEPAMTFGKRRTPETPSPIYEV